MIRAATSNVRALLFDMDGTLVDSMPWHLRSWVALLAEHGVTVDPHDFLLETAGTRADVILRERLGATLSDSEVARLAGEKELRYRAMYGPHVQLIAGAAEFLKKAQSRGIDLALASAAPEDNVRFILDRTGLGSMFNAVVTADDGFPGKPAPDIFLAAAARIGTLPRNSLVFEDALNGVEAARSAAMRVVVLSTSLTPEEIPRGPDVLAVAADYTTLDLDALTSTSDS